MAPLILKIFSFRGSYRRKGDTWALVYVLNKEAEKKNRKNKKVPLTKISRCLSLLPFLHTCGYMCTVSRASTKEKDKREQYDEKKVRNRKSAVGTRTMDINTATWGGI